jgi:predicted small lipoprotein YifL
MTRLILLISAISCFALLGCGQSGPLYLPGDPSQVSDAPRPAEIADEEEDDDGDDGSRPE